MIGQMMTLVVSAADPLLHWHPQGAGLSSHKLRLMQNYPPGPADQEGLDAWPVEVAVGLGDLQSGLFQFRVQGIWWYTDYSGVECPRWGWTRLTDILDAGGQVCWERWARTCDIGSRQTQFLVKLHEVDGKGACHQLDIIKRLHPQAQEYIAAALPSAKDSKNQRAAAHDEILEWLQANRAWAYPLKSVAKSYCICHDMDCPTWPGLVEVEDAPADPWRTNS